MQAKRLHAAHQEQQQRMETTMASSAASTASTSTTATAAATATHAKAEKQKQQNRKLLPTGFICDERFYWYSSRSDSSGSTFAKWIQPHQQPWESPESKRRFHNLVIVSGLIKQLDVIQPQEATMEQLLLFHEQEYVQLVQEMSDREGGGSAGAEARWPTA